MKKKTLLLIYETRIRTHGTLRSFQKILHFLTEKEKHLL